MVQLSVVLLLAAALKLHYSTATVNGMRWILAPTAYLVELLTGTGFSFEPYAGYMSSDHTFLIAAPCAGINFFITAFLMLAIADIFRKTTQFRWGWIATGLMIAYLTTILANTVRISAALQMHRMEPDVVWVNPDQMHRLEGIFVYFGFLLLLFFVNEKIRSDKSPFAKRGSLLRRSLVPLLAYYSITLVVPLVNGAYRQGAAFLEHALFVLLTPPVIIGLLYIVRPAKKQPPLI